MMTRFFKEAFEQLGHHVQGQGLIIDRHRRPGGNRFVGSGRTDRCGFSRRLGDVTDSVNLALRRYLHVFTWVRGRHHRSCFIRCVRTTGRNQCQNQ